jgi:hypothetical protein
MNRAVACAAARAQGRVVGRSGPSPTPRFPTGTVTGAFPAPEGTPKRLPLGRGCGCMAPCADPNCTRRAGGDRPCSQQSTHGAATLDTALPPVTLGTRRHKGPSPKRRGATVPLRCGTAGVQAQRGSTRAGGRRTGAIGDSGGGGACAAPPGRFKRCGGQGGRRGSSTGSGAIEQASCLWRVRAARGAHGAAGHAARSEGVPEGRAGRDGVPQGARGARLSEL